MTIDRQAVKKTINATTRTLRKEMNKICRLLETSLGAVADIYLKDAKPKKTKKTAQPSGSK